MSSDPIKEFESLLAASDYLFVLYYRGHWCPFCLAHIRELVALTPTLAAAHATPLIVTAQVTASSLEATRASTGYTGAAIVDPENLLAAELKRRGWVDVAISIAPRFWEYPHGMAQPAVLVVRRDSTVLESWAIVPSLMNLHGASDRPKLEQIWSNALAQEKGESAPHEAYTTTWAVDLLQKTILGFFGW